MGKRIIQKKLKEKDYKSYLSSRRKIMRYIRRMVAINGKVLTTTLVLEKVKPFYPGDKQLDRVLKCYYQNCARETICQLAKNGKLDLQEFPYTLPTIDKKVSKKNSSKLPNEEHERRLKILRNALEGFLIDMKPGKAFTIKSAVTNLNIDLLNDQSLYPKYSIFLRPWFLLLTERRVLKMETYGAAWIYTRTSWPIMKNTFPEILQTSYNAKVKK